MTASTDTDHRFFVSHHLSTARVCRRSLAITMAVGLLSTSAIADDDLNPRLPDQFDKEAFTRELNRGAQSTTSGGDDSASPSNAQIIVDSYGSRRFVDVIEIRPANGPRYFLVDDEGDGAPNVGGARTEGDLSERRSISKWRLGKW